MARTSSGARWKGVLKYTARTWQCLVACDLVEDLFCVLGECLGEWTAMLGPRERAAQSEKCLA